MRGDERTTVFRCRWVGLSAAKPIASDSGSGRRLSHPAQRHSAQPHCPARPGGDMLKAMAQPFVEPCDRGVIAAQPCPREPRRETDLQRRRMVLAACVLASAMAFIDGSALSVALPKLRAYFSADFASVQWVLNGYVLALSALTLIGGALA